MEIKWKKSCGPRPEVREKNGVVWLSFPLLEATGMVVQGFTTRLGGVSRGVYSSMNLSYTRGDDPAAVTENFRRAGEAMGFPLESIVASDPGRCLEGGHDRAGADHGILIPVFKLFDF